METDHAALQEIVGKILSAPLKQEPEDFYQPRQQNYHEFSGEVWKPIGSNKKILSSPRPPLSILRLITWNIDVLSPGGKPRMEAALTYLRDLVSDISTRSEATVIFFQEMSESDLEQIQLSDWVKERFYVTDVDGENWLKPVFGPLYGTTILIEKSLNIEAVFRVNYPSRFGRDALFVDLVSPDATPKSSVFRLCNTHLESLVASPPVRNLQAAAAAAWMKKTEVFASVLAGDLNAIESFDRSLHSDNGLKDAYLELGGMEDSGEGYTWGQQAPKALREQFGCSRMDKVFFRGGIKPLVLDRIGEGVQVQDKVEREAIIDAGGEIWASDHLGLLIRMELNEPV